MADLTITAANVAKAADNNNIASGTAGGTITAGMPVYQDSADSNHLKACRANAATTDEAVGIALHAASDGQPLTYLKSGDIDLGATLTVGETYVVSAAAAGGIAPIGDLASTNYVTILGVASAADNLKLSIQVSSTAKP